MKARKGLVSHSQLRNFGSPKLRWSRSDLSRSSNAVRIYNELSFVLSFFSSLFWRWCFEAHIIERIERDSDNKDDARSTVFTCSTHSHGTFKYFNGALCLSRGIFREQKERERERERDLLYLTSPFSRSSVSPFVSLPFLRPFLVLSSLIVQQPPPPPPPSHCGARYTSFKPSFSSLTTGYFNWIFAESLFSSMPRGLCAIRIPYYW